MTLSVYNPSTGKEYDALNSLDYFVSIDIMVEFFAAGVVHPTYVNVIPFKANIFELSGEKAL